MKMVTRRCSQILPCTLLAILLSSSRAAYSQTNAGFETGDFTGWTVSGPTTNTMVAYGLFGGSPHTGGYQAFFGNYDYEGDTTISQMFATNPGGLYDISFWVQVVTATGHNGIGHATSSFDGITLNDDFFTQSDSDPQGPWIQRHFTVAASGSQSLFTFGAYSPPGYIGLDDVSITESAVPEGSSLAAFGVPALLGGFLFFRRRLRRH
jgi:hypothetical protein